VNGAGSRNRSISTFVVAFAALSLVASALPLLSHGNGDASLVPGLDRGTSFAAYSLFLLLFAFFFLPGAFRGDPGPGLGRWAPLAAFALLFATVPAVTAAYISGVARPQALGMGGLVASACAIVILLRAFAGTAATAVAFAIGGLTLFVLPAIEALAWTTGTPLRVPVGALSLVSWMRRLVFVREPVNPAWIMAAAGVLWIVVIVAGVRRARAAAALGLVVLAPLAALPEAPPSASVRPVLGTFARAGVRLPFAISVKGEGGEAEVAFRSESVKVPADGQSYPALVALTQGETEAEVILGAERARVLLPLRWGDPSKPLVGALGSSFAQTVATVARKAEVVAFELSAAPQVPGALEVFDTIAVAAADWGELRAEQRGLLERYAALSGNVVVVGDSPGSRPESRRTGLVQSVSHPWMLADLDLRRPFEVGPDAFDRTPASGFERPDWQALDLTKLLLFLVAYHAAFLVAFLLPLLLDSHKSPAVYLISVGTVIVVVVGVAWWSLRQFFLRDNQVFTQSLTFVAVGAPPGDAVVRQLRSYASMSGELRDFPWDEARDLVVYRDPGSPRRTLAAGAGRRLDDVWLDRFDSRLVVREDVVQRSPLELVPEDGGWRLRPVADAPDPLGIRLARVVSAAVIEPDRTVRLASIEGNRIAVRPDAGPVGAEVLDAMVRPLIGRFRRRSPEAPARLVLVRASGVRRLDDCSGYFRTVDRDAVFAFEAP
jgi:hypothetical protein